MELVRATQDFVIAGQPYPKFPILLWDSMESCVPANQFFRHYLLRGEIGSDRSWPSAGRALYDFFSFLQAHEMNWRDVDRGEAKSLVAAYRDYCLVTCELGPNTTRQRLSYICKFYKYALKEGWVNRLPFSFEERTVSRESRFLAHVDASGGKNMANDVMPRCRKVLPKFLSMAEIKSLLAAAENPHHRMMIRLALHTGLRREEIAAFPLAYILDPPHSLSLSTRKSPTVIAMSSSPLTAALSIRQARLPVHVKVWTVRPAAKFVRISSGCSGQISANCMAGKGESCRVQSGRYHVRESNH